MFGNFECWGTLVVWELQMFRNFKCLGTLNVWLRLNGNMIWWTTIKIYDSVD